MGTQDTSQLRHNHITRDIKPQGECPACDVYHTNVEARRATEEESA